MMNRMDAQRFEALAEAHGAAIGRWPKNEQDAAFAFLADQPETAQVLLAQAQALDEALDALRPPAPSAALRHAVIAAAPRARRPGAWSRWLAGAGIGAALATACAAGVVVGVGVGASASQSTGGGDLDEVSRMVSVEDDWIALPETESRS